MTSVTQLRQRRPSQLFSLFHGCELDERNDIVAVMEQQDGTPRLIGSDTVFKVLQAYKETPAPLRTPAHMAEAALMDDAAGLMNDLRIARFAPKPTPPVAAFLPVAATMPLHIRQLAITVLQPYTTKVLTP